MTQYTAPEIEVTKKRHFQPLTMGHKVTFNFKRTHFFKRESTSTTQGLCFESTSSTDDSFAVIRPPGPSVSQGK